MAAEFCRHEQKGAHVVNCQRQSRTRATAAGLATRPRSALTVKSFYLFLFIFIFLLATQSLLPPESDADKSLTEKIDSLSCLHDSIAACAILPHAHSQKFLERKLECKSNRITTRVMVRHSKEHFVELVLGRAFDSCFARALEEIACPAFQRGQSVFDSAHHGATCLEQINVLIARLPC